MSNNEMMKEKRYVGVKETVLYGVANGGQVIGYNMVRMQMTFFLVTVFGIPSEAAPVSAVCSDPARHSHRRVFRRRGIPLGRSVRCGQDSLYVPDLFHMGILLYDR